MTFTLATHIVLRTDGRPTSDPSISRAVLAVLNRVSPDWPPTKEIVVAFNGVPFVVKPAHRGLSAT